MTGCVTAFRRWLEVLPKDPRLPWTLALEAWSHVRGQQCPGRRPCGSSTPVVSTPHGVSQQQEAVETVVTDLERDPPRLTSEMDSGPSRSSKDVNASATLSRTPSHLLCFDGIPRQAAAATESGAAQWAPPGTSFRCTAVKRTRTCIPMPRTEIERALGGAMQQL